MIWLGYYQQPTAQEESIFLFMTVMFFGFLIDNNSQKGRSVYHSLIYMVDAQYSVTNNKTQE